MAHCLIRMYHFHSLSGAKWNKLSLRYYINNSSNHLTASQRQSIIQQAFSAWESVSKLSFTQVYSESSADLKIKWATGNHGDTEGFDGTDNVLAHAYSPPPLGGSYAGQIHFDDDENWTETMLLGVATHEIGHALGLGHSSVSGAIMNQYYTGQTALGSDDILGIGALYGSKENAISGPAMIGGTASGSYTVNYKPADATLTWSYSSDLLTQVSSSANGIVLKPKTPTTVGDASIIARLTYSNGNVQQIYYYVGINGPHWRNVQLVVTKSSDGSEAYPTGGLCPNTYYYARLSTGGTILTNVNWGASPELQVLSATNNQLYFRTLSQGWGTLNITATTSYGVTKKILGVTLMGGGCSSTPYYSISAASNMVDIRFNIDVFCAGINEQVYTKPPVFDVRMYSLTGVLVKQARSSGEDIQLDVSTLSRGSYVVHIYDGISEMPQTQIIQISH